ncbi:MAG: oligosaccharide flippase family protein [Bacteroidetes bacterium]|nr:oligosaccharide flippase family protein [Bacteroidota bacterium]
MKRTRTRTSRWNIFFQYSNIIFNFITGIVLVPLYLKNITTEVYGLWLGTGSILAMITLVDPGFGIVLQQKISSYYGEKDYKIVGQYALMGIIIIVPFLILFAILCLIFSFTISYWFDINDLIILAEITRAFNFAFLGSLILLFSYNLISINHGLQSSLSIGLINVVASLSGIILTIILLEMGFGIVAIGITLLWRSIIVGLGNLGYMLYRFNREKIKFKYNARLLNEIVSFSVYTFLGKAGNALSTQLNMFISSSIISPTSASVLKFTQALPDNSKLIIDRPAYALLPAISHMIGEKNSVVEIKIIVLRFVRFIIWGSGLIFIIFLKLNQSFVSLWVGETFYGGNLLNLLIILMIILTIFSNSISYFVFALGDIKRSNLMQFIKSLLLVPMLFLGAQKWGLIGIIGASIIAELLITTWYFPLSLYRRIQGNKDDIAQLFYETLRVLLIIILFTTDDNNILKNWSLLIFYAIFYCSIYFCLIFIISKNFRMEINNILMQIRIKLHLI